MDSIDYIGFDIHKKTISFCAKAQDGRILDEGTIPARRPDLRMHRSRFPSLRLRGLRFSLVHGLRRPPGGVAKTKKTAAALINNEAIVVLGPRPWQRIILCHSRDPSQSPFTSNLISGCD